MDNTIGVLAKISDLTTKSILIFHIQFNNHHHHHIHTPTHTHTHDASGGDGRQYFRQQKKVIWHASSIVIWLNTHSTKGSPIKRNIRHQMTPAKICHQQ
jgi:hypothetical protein